MDMEYIIGKNAEHNTHLCQTMAPYDVWFHISKLPSAHLIMKNPDKVSLDKLRKDGIIYRMANRLKVSSKYRKTHLLKVDYCYGKNIKTTPVPGRVVTRSCLVITV